MITFLRSRETLTVIGLLVFIEYIILATKYGAFRNPTKYRDYQYYCAIMIILLVTNIDHHTTIGAILILFIYVIGLVYFFIKDHTKS